MSSKKKQDSSSSGKSLEDDESGGKKVSFVKVYQDTLNEGKKGNFPGRASTSLYEEGSDHRGLHDFRGVISGCVLDAPGAFKEPKRDYRRWPPHVDYFISEDLTTAGTMKSIFEKQIEPYLLKQGDEKSKAAKAIAMMNGDLYCKKELNQFDKVKETYYIKDSSKVVQTFGAVTGTKKLVGEEKTSFSPEDKKVGSMAELFVGSLEASLTKAFGLWQEMTGGTVDFTGVKVRPTSGGPYLVVRPFKNNEIGYGNMCCEPRFKLPVDMEYEVDPNSDNWRSAHKVKTGGRLAICLSTLFTWLRPYKEEINVLVPLLAKKAFIPTWVAEMCHELGHMLGLDHEFDHPHRDLFLQNVNSRTSTLRMSRLIDAYGKKAGDKVEFDYGSIMMYPSLSVVPKFDAYKKYVRNSEKYYAPSMLDAIVVIAAVRFWIETRKNPKKYEKWLNKSSTPPASDPYYGWKAHPNGSVAEETLTEENTAVLLSINLSWNTEEEALKTAAAVDLVGYAPFNHTLSINVASFDPSKTPIKSPTEDLQRKYLQCKAQYVFNHELGHVLGMGHEFQRSDALQDGKQFGTGSDYERISNPDELNFGEINISTAKVISTAYDKDSVMHYEPSLVFKKKVSGLEASGDVTVKIMKESNGSGGTDVTVPAKIAPHVLFAETHRKPSTLDAKTVAVLHGLLTDGDIKKRGLEGGDDMVTMLDSLYSQLNGNVSPEDLWKKLCEWKKHGLSSLPIGLRNVLQAQGQRGLIQEDIMPWPKATIKYKFVIGEEIAEQNIVFNNKTQKGSVFVETLKTWMTQCMTDWDNAVKAVASNKGITFTAVV